MNEVKEEAAQGERQELTDKQLLLEIADNLRIIKFYCEFFANVYKTSISQMHHTTESAFRRANERFIKEDAEKRK